MNMMDAFSTNCVYIKGSCTVQGLGVTGVLLRSLEAGLEGRSSLTVKSSFPGWVMWREQGALWLACELGVQVSRA